MHLYFTYMIIHIFTRMIDYFESIYLLQLIFNLEKFLEFNFLTMDYLNELISERKIVSVLQGPYQLKHTGQLLDSEIENVRARILNNKTIDGPAKSEMNMFPQKKVFFPKGHEKFNLVGRILGSRGVTIKQLENETGCKIIMRGRGSLGDKIKEEAKRGKPNWEHLEEELHIFITSDDVEWVAHKKVEKAANKVEKLLEPGGFAMKRKNN